MDPQSTGWGSGLDWCGSG